MADSDCTRFTGLYGPAYQERRLEALLRDGHRCCACDHDGSIYRLEAHHRTYKNGSDPALEDLYTFCVRCHDVWTDMARGDRYAARDIPVPEHTCVGPAPRPDVPTRIETVTVELRPTVTVRIELPEKQTARVQEFESHPRARPNF